MTNLCKYAKISIKMHLFFAFDSFSHKNEKYTLQKSMF